MQPISAPTSALPVRSCSHCSPASSEPIGGPHETFTASSPSPQASPPVRDSVVSASGLQASGGAAVLESLQKFHLPAACLPALAELAREHPSEKITHVLYHAHCQDGFGAAYGAWKALGDKAEYIGVTYQRPVPELPSDARVALVDFSYPREQLEQLRGQVADLVVLDHHKSAQEGLAGLDYAVFDMERAGAGLAWHYFNPDQPLPELIAHVEKRDLWDFESLDRTRQVYSGLASYEQDFATWDGLSGQVDRLKTEGATIERMQGQQLERILRSAQIGTICGHQVPVVNSPVLQSELGHALLQKFPDAPFAGAYHDLPDGRRKWSLRGREGGLDVSSICQQFGGGGHAAAGGFEEPTVRSIRVEPPPATSPS